MMTSAICWKPTTAKDFPKITGETKVYLPSPPSIKMNKDTFPRIKYIIQVISNLGKFSFDLCQSEKGCNLCAQKIPPV